MTCNQHLLFERVLNLNILPLISADCFQDQTVKWHATPFEERLDKALSEENFISKRYPSLVNNHLHTYSSVKKYKKQKIIEKLQFVHAILSSNTVC